MFNDYKYLSRDLRLVKASPEPLYSFISQVVEHSPRGTIWPLCVKLMALPFNHWFYLKNSPIFSDSVFLLERICISWFNVHVGSYSFSSVGVELLLVPHRKSRKYKFSLPLCHKFPPLVNTRLHAEDCWLIWITSVSSLLLWQGLTGRPGDAGPQGKVGPSVSAQLSYVFLFL